MAYVVGKFYGKIWNQGIRCPTNRQHEKSNRQPRLKKAKGSNFTLKILNKTEYNELILSQEYTVYF